MPPCIPVTSARRLIGEHERAPASRANLRRLARLENDIRTELKSADANAWALGILYERVARSRLDRLTEHEHRTLTAWANATFPNHGHRTLQRYRRVAKALTSIPVPLHHRAPAHIESPRHSGRVRSNEASCGRATVRACASRLQRDGSPR